MPDLKPEGSFLDGLSVGNRLYRPTWWFWARHLVVVAVLLGAIIVVLGLASEAWLDADGASLSPEVLAPDLVLSIALQLAAASVLGAAVGQVRASTPSVSDAVRPLRSGSVWTVSVVIGAIACLLDALTFVGGSAATTFAVFVVLHAIDGAAPAKAFSAGLGVYRNRFWSRIGFILVVSFFGGIGVLACIVGLLATIPISALAVALVHVGDHDADSAADAAGNPR